MRDGPVRHPSTLFHHTSGHSRLQTYDVIHRKPLVWRFTSQAASRCRHGSIRCHNSFTSEQHLSASLHRIHRLLVEGERHVYACSRRHCPIRPTGREHEACVQGQKEAGLSHQRAFRLNLKTYLPTNWTPKGKYNKNESLINVLCSNLHYHFGRCEFKKNLFVNLLMRPIAASTKNDFALFEWNMD